MTFAKRLVELRDGRAMAQRTAARRCGVSLNTYRRWERDLFPNLLQLARIADAFDLSLHELLLPVVISPNSKPAAA